jgi:large subunit ribosomal protein L15
MKLKKRNKKSRARGDRTLGWAMKKHKGSGNRGGKGMAGTGKRADQRKTWVIKYQYPYFGKQGTTSKSTRRKVNNVINVGELDRKYKAGEISLFDYKILGEGEVSGKFTIKAMECSQSAREKVEKAGGKIILVDENGNEIAGRKEEKKEEKKEGGKTPEKKEGKKAK